MNNPTVDMRLFPCLPHEIEAIQDGRMTVKRFVIEQSDPKVHVKKCPYGKAGDRISVTENLEVEIKSVRIESLQFISVADAEISGLKKHNLFGEFGGVEPHHSVPGHYKWFRSARQAFKSLWEATHGPKSWDLNPWVYVVEFRSVPA